MKIGYVFDGDSYDQKIDTMFSGLQEVLEMFSKNEEQWQNIRSNAKKVWFTCEKSIDDYNREPYWF